MLLYICIGVGLVCVRAFVALVARVAVVALVAPVARVATLECNRIAGGINWR